MTAGAILEAILFVAEEPLPVEELAALLEIPRDDVAAELAQYADRLEAEDRGITLREIGGGWRLYSKPEFRPYLERFAASARAARLSKAALETLAVVAYKQPVSRSQVSEIRGVDADRALSTLEQRGLIEEVGRAGGPGQAVLFGTSAEFLERLGLRSLDDLPPLADHVPPAEIVDVLERPFRPEEPSNDSRN
jgi:segregation and condensation protein B